MEVNHKMSCIDGKNHDFEYSVFEQCFVCNGCKAQKNLIEDPEEFENIAKFIVQYCQEFGRNYDLIEGMIPIIKGITNLTYLWIKERKK